MDPLSIYWNSVWQDAQRAHRDEGSPVTHARPSPPRRRTGCLADHAKGPVIGVAIMILAVGTIVAVM